MSVRTHLAIVVTMTVLGVAGCGGAQQETALGIVPQGTQVDLRESSYDVTATSADAIGQQIRANGWYRFNWRLNWRYGYGPVQASSIDPTASNETVCGTRNIRLTLEYTSRLPRWTARADAPAELGAQWDAWMTEVKRFGEGHRDIALDAVREVRRRLGDLRTENCAFMERAARRLVDEVIARHQERTVAYYDGAQRVPWPPRPGG